jgi:hypothetical protein
MIPSFVERAHHFFTTRLALLLRHRRDLTGPRRLPNDAAKITAVEMRILVRQHVGFDVAKGRIRPVLDPVVESIDNIFLEMRRPRERFHDCFALCSFLASKRLLRRLSVFAGGFTLDAASAITGNEACVAVDDIANLVSKSFVTLDGAAFGDRWRL